MAPPPPPATSPVSEESEEEIAYSPRPAAPKTMAPKGLPPPTTTATGPVSEESEEEEIAYSRPPAAPKIMGLFGTPVHASAVRYAHHGLAAAARDPWRVGKPALFLAAGGWPPRGGRGPFGGIIPAVAAAAAASWFQTGPMAPKGPPPPATVLVSEESESEEDEIAYSRPPSAPKTMAPPPPPTATGLVSEESEEGTAYSPPPVAPMTMWPKGDDSEDKDDDDVEEQDEDEVDEEEEEEKTIQVPPPLGSLATKSWRKPGGPFQRTWSTDDEVRILEALAAHRREYGTLPKVDALAATLAGTLDNDNNGRSLALLQGKINSLKRRYRLAASNGKPPSRDHDRRLFDISKSVWGSTTVAANGGARMKVAEMCELYPYLAEEVMALQKVYSGLFKREFVMIKDDKARELDTKIKRQRLEQVKVSLHHCDLAKEVTRTLIDLAERHS